MFRESDLQDCLYGLVGWRQNDNPDYPTLPPSLIATDSGLYFQDINSELLSIENIDQATKNYDKYPFTAYAEHANYIPTNRVRYSDNKVYEANTTITDAPAILDTNDWTEVNLLAQRLEQITRAAITGFTQTMFIQKKLNTVTKSIFENIQLFDGAGSMTNKELKQGRFVGFELRMFEHRDITIELRRLGTQFTQANPSLKIYVFHSSQMAPIATFTQTLTRANSFEWSPLKVSGKDFVLRYLGDYLPGGSFYIGYYEDDLTGQAINKGYDFGRAPASCSTCNQNYRYWSNWSSYFDVLPIEVAAANLPDDVLGVPQLWDINKNGYVYTKNYGLNLDISAKCDVTDFFCRERRLFAGVLQKQVYVDVLQIIANSTRNNVISKEVRELALFELNKPDNKEYSAYKVLENAIGAISFDMSDLNESCLPCNEKRGGTWSAI